MTGDHRVLVIAASRYGATRGIAEALAARLGGHAGLTAAHVTAEHAPDPTPYDAVVLGSAVYVGRWLKPAGDWAATWAGALRGRPVWLFSSGPIGTPPFPPDEPYDVVPLSRMTGARGHAVFPGRLDKALLGFGERAMVTAMRAPVGDFRDWAAVSRWADEIATDLLNPDRTATPTRA